MVLSVKIPLRDPPRPLAGTLPCGDRTFLSLARAAIHPASADTSVACAYCLFDIQRAVTFDCPHERVRQRRRIQQKRRELFLRFRRQSDVMLRCGLRRQPATGFPSIDGLHTSAFLLSGYATYNPPHTTPNVKLNESGGVAQPVRATVS